MQAWLDANLPIPAACLWRDDLDRRLERSLSLQWRYPEVLTGPAAIRLALESQLSTHQQRRASALRGFVSYQFDGDAEVKFKQVDLRNDLFALFVDVPADFSERVGGRITTAQRFAYYRAAAAMGSLNYHDGTADFLSTGLMTGSTPYFGLAPGIGAASLLLNEGFQQQTMRAVLEGAPGQGKSTLAQYVCQVHRCRYLDREALIANLPDAHRRSAVRLPIKVDLRDLAVWLQGKDPFKAEQPPLSQATTLESFLAHQVSVRSGGVDFSSFDLSESLRGVPTLLFLDGLDEVADVNTRRQLVDEVNHGLNRLDSLGVETQVVITSRPAAFANSPGFPTTTYTYLELGNLPQEIVVDYAERWIRARDLDETDASDVREILREKLQLPHIRDLARNPMQLAILLGLIHTIGYSLPDERTELYASYMDKFLTREAEKSPAVRKHRALLVRIHQHLAWVLQSEAESTGASGSITANQLRDRIQQFLKAHERSDEILDELFTGVLERVYVLVQRIEGAYEFEVQPIREFFCATYLYETSASAGPTRGDLGGTRLERFDVLARSPYWTNVCRFYAGCYTSGELGGLYMQIEEFKEESAHRLTLRPRELGVTLLKDWVFKNSPRVTRHVAECVFD